jgi:DNA-binding NtrC family response regulator
VSHPSVATLALCAAEPCQAQSQGLQRALAGMGHAAHHLTLASLQATPSGHELLIQVVAPDDVPAAVQQLARLRDAAPACATLVAGIELDVKQLDTLLQAGAGDFMRLPIAPVELEARVHRALGLVDGQAPPGLRPIQPELHDLIGDSPAFARQVARLPLIARYDASVLILGETGTGKEVCARAIHYLSDRAGSPWVAVNCGAIPTELIEAELFGHVKGAFTHAQSARVGLVREAEGGTLFLDEIDALPCGAQAKLLRFLQEKEYRAVGSNQVMHANVRVIAATNRSPAQLAARGGFRQDLLFRLNVLSLHLPLLRERSTDIPTLALHFMRGAAKQWGRPLPSLSPTALKMLMAHDWPGNVRELRNVMDRAVLMSATQRLTAEDIELDGRAGAICMPAEDESFRSAKARVVEQFERGYIEQLLASHAGNVTHAARAAKKNRRAFFELMRKYKIESGEFLATDRAAQPI